MRRQPLRIGWLSGVSRVGTRTLCPLQRALIERLPVPADAKLWTNFPYGARRGAADDAPFRDTNLAVASVVNFGRYLAACQPMRRRATVTAWREVKSSCDRLLLITGSCGSQIVRALEAADSSGATVETLAFGPVDLSWGSGSSSLRETRVGGEGDWLARRVEHRLPGVGHMDYLDSPCAVDFALRWVRERAEGQE